MLCVVGLTTLSFVLDNKCGRPTKPFYITSVLVSLGPSELSVIQWCPYRGGVRKRKESLNCPSTTYEGSTMISNKYKTVTKERDEIA